MLLYRFLIGSLAFVPFAHRAGTRIARTHWPALLMASLLGVPVQFLVQFEGLARTTVAHASLMVAGLPILLAVGPAFFGRERLARWEWGALAVSTLGAAAIAVGADDAGPDGPTLLGDGLVLRSRVATVGWILLSRRLTRVYSSPAISVTTTWVGTVVLLVWTLVRDGRPLLLLSLPTWLALAGQGVLATMGATMRWNSGVSRVPAARCRCLRRSRTHCRYRPRRRSARREPGGVRRLWAAS